MSHSSETSCSTGVCRCHRPSCGARGDHWRQTALLLLLPSPALPTGWGQNSPRCLQSCTFYPSPHLPHKSCSAPLLQCLQQIHPRQNQAHRVPGKQEAFPSPIMCSKALDIRRTACPFHCIATNPDKMMMVIATISELRVFPLEQQHSRGANRGCVTRDRSVPPSWDVWCVCQHT